MAAWDDTNYIKKVGFAFCGGFLVDLKLGRLAFESIFTVKNNFENTTKNAANTRFTQVCSTLGGQNNVRYT
jgi:hypothetical protein